MNILFQGKFMGNKRLAIRISCSYETNRLAEKYLLDAYEKAVSKQVSQKKFKT
nr:hypothetical protein [Rickettsia endosymbiont of Ceutorhynchus assimilis]